MSCVCAAGEVRVAGGVNGGWDEAGAVEREDGSKQTVWCGAGVYQTRCGQVRGGMLAAEGGGDNYVAELVAHSSRRSRRNRTGAD